jgi:hypothetical protein
MSYLYKGVVLTKYNLTRKNWTGSKHCSFCMTHETIQHIFFDCINARFLWGLVQITIGLRPPSKQESHAWFMVTGNGKQFKTTLLYITSHPKKLLLGSHIAL